MVIKQQDLEQDLERLVLIMSGQVQILAERAQNLLLFLGRVLKRFITFQEEVIKQQDLDMAMEFKRVELISILMILE